MPILADATPPPIAHALYTMLEGRDAGKNRMTKSQRRTMLNDESNPVRAEREWFRSLRSPSQCRSRGEVCSSRPTLTAGPYQARCHRTPHRLRRLPPTEPEDEEFHRPRSGHHCSRLMQHVLKSAPSAARSPVQLRLNEDLAEALSPGALSRPPAVRPRRRGHARRVPRRVRRINHNRQGLRIVEELEQRYPDFPGLEPVARSARKPARPRDQDRPHGAAAIGGQIVDAADSIVYAFCMPTWTTHRKSASWSSPSCSRWSRWNEAVRRAARRMPGSCAVRSGGPRCTS